MIVFQSLHEESVRKILKPILDEICGNLEKQHKAKLQIGEEVEKFVAQMGYSPQYGVLATAPDRGETHPGVFK